MARTAQLSFEPAIDVPLSERELRAVLLTLRGYSCSLDDYWSGRRKLQAALSKIQATEKD